MGDYQKGRLVLWGVIIGCIILIGSILVSQNKDTYKYYGTITEVFKCNYYCDVKGETDDGKELLIRFNEPSAYVGQKFVVNCYKDSDLNNRERCFVAAFY
ncbi:MAG: hypothetical protein R3230_00165 [Nitrosopumilaceae archaeon]|nr:hypothetical protein [Nitrosopumilaceae archaeon]